VELEETLKRVSDDVKFGAEGETFIGGCERLEASSASVSLPHRFLRMIVGDGPRLVGRGANRESA
jgi:hypothetical protein